MSHFQVINGFVCFNCADVALAKKDINPAHPPGSPSNPTGATGANPSQTSNGSPPSQGTSPGATPSVTFGGTLAQLNGQPPPTQPSQQTYQPGSQLNATA